MRIGEQILIIGAGAMGRAIAHDLTTRQPHYGVTVLDHDRGALEKLPEITGKGLVLPVIGHANDAKLVSQLLSECRVAIGAASYKLNLMLMEAALSTATGWVDLGGNNRVVQHQFQLRDSAIKAGVSAIPDCGLAPGLVNIIAADMLNRLESVDEMQFRVGGLPFKPHPPLFYGLVFSPEGLINEYLEPSECLRGKRKITVPPLTGWEKVFVGPPVGSLEAFHTSGGASTLVNSLEGRVNRLEYKTLRYHGHLAKIKLLADLGLFSGEETDLGDGGKVAPRAVMERLLEKLGWVSEDLVVLKAWASGLRNGRKYGVAYRMFDRNDPTTGLTAMARCTGFAAAIAARMILDGRIAQKGVLNQEFVVPPTAFFQEMKERGIEIVIEERQDGFPGSGTVV